MTRVSPIISITEIVQTIPRRTLKVSPICPRTETIFLSAIGSERAAARLKETDIIASFIIGIIHIASTTNIPTKPSAFFNILLHPSTASTVSPKILPTTGIALVTTAFVVLIVIPSTLLVSVPSNDNTPTNIVSTIPKAQTTLDLKNFDNLFIWILSDIWDIIPREVPTNISGRNTEEMIFPYKSYYN